MNNVTPEQIRTTLDLIERMNRESANASDPGAFVEACWAAVDPASRPAFFRLLDIAADLPRLGANQTLANLPAGLWPQLSQVAEDIVRLQTVVDHPLVPAQSIMVNALADPEQAHERLDAHHCATIDFFLDADQESDLDAVIEDLRPTKEGTWGALARDESPELYALMETGLGSPGFRHVTGFDPARDTFSLTLSLQRLEPTGIGWHRDLYWPAEWVGQDVFAVFYALGSDSPEKGGAFTYYLPWTNQIHHFYRQRHQATVLWNSADPDGRILHAVAGFHTDGTERHLIILQCLRRPNQGR